LRYRGSHRELLVTGFATSSGDRAGQVLSMVSVAIPLCYLPECLLKF
jgi:hypothetical protein